MSRQSKSGPWSTAGLARKGISRAGIFRKDVYVSAEWAQLHEAAFGFEDESAARSDLWAKRARDIALSLLVRVLRIPRSA